MYSVACGCAKMETKSTFVENENICMMFNLTNNCIMNYRIKVSF